MVSLIKYLCFYLVDRSYKYICINRYTEIHAYVVRLYAGCKKFKTTTNMYIWWYTICTVSSFFLSFASCVLLHSVVSLSIKLKDFYCANLLTILENIIEKHDNNDGDDAWLTWKQFHSRPRNAFQSDFFN